MFGLIEVCRDQDTQEIFGCWNHKLNQFRVKFYFKAKIVFRRTENKYFCEWSLNKLVHIKQITSNLDGPEYTLPVFLFTWNGAYTHLGAPAGQQ